MSNIIALILSVVCLGNVAYAYPRGTGSCVGGEPAVNGPHVTTPTITNGTLGEFDMIFGIDGTELTADSTGSYTTGVPFIVAVNASQTNMRGCFIRFETEDMSSSSVFELIPDDNTQIASVCSSTDSATGITHSGSSEKQTCSGEVTITYSGRVMVDVTTVISLEEDSSSTFAYTRYILESDDTTSSQTDPPTDSLETDFPTEAPVAAPGDNNKPVEAPVMKPVEAPPAAPVDKPATTPVEAPVSAPTSNGGIQIYQVYRTMVVTVLGILSVYSFFF